MLPREGWEIFKSLVKAALRPVGLSCNHATKLGPCINVIQKMEKGEGVIGLDTDEINSGRINVAQDIKEARNVTGVRARRIGQGRRAFRVFGEGEVLSFGCLLHHITTTRRAPQVDKTDDML